MSLLFPWPSLNRFWLLLQAMETRGKEEELGKAAEGGCGQDREHSQAPLPTCPPGSQCQHPEQALPPKLLVFLLSQHLHFLPK